MSAHLHEYPVTVEWTGGREGAGTATANRSGVVNTLSVPPEFQGPGEGTNPEELLTSAIASCYSVTFGIIATNRKIPFHGIKTEAVGEVEQAGAMFNYKRIVLRPTITVAADITEEQLKIAEDMAHKADGYCIITNAVRGKVEVVVEPTFVKA